MPLDEQLDRLSYVDAALNYLVPMAEKPVNYNYEPPAGTPWRNGEYRPEPVRIRDARPLIGELSLDKQGFALTRHETKVASFYDPAAVKAVYYPEMEQLVTAATGARRVVCFDHIVRHAPKAENRVTASRSRPSGCITIIPRARGRSACATCCRTRPRRCWRAASRW